MWISFSKLTRFSLTLASSWLYNPSTTLLPKESFTSSTQRSPSYLQNYILTPYSGLQISILLEVGFKELKVLLQFKIQRWLSATFHNLYSHFWDPSQPELFILTPNTNCTLGSGYLLMSEPLSGQYFTIFLQDLHSNAACNVLFLTPLSILEIDLFSNIHKTAPNKSLTRSWTIETQTNKVLHLKNKFQKWTVC